jgi:hypothetical protein
LIPQAGWIPNGWFALMATPAGGKFAQAAGAPEHLVLDSSKLTEPEQLDWLPFQMN